MLSIRARQEKRKHMCSLMLSSLSILVYSIAMTNTKCNVGEEKVYRDYTSRSQSITEGSWGRNSKEEIMEDAVCWLVCSCLVSFLMKPRATCFQAVMFVMVWPSLHQLIIKTIHHTHVQTQADLT